MTNFPTSIDTLTNPTASDPQNNPSHSAQHANANDAIEALEAKVGITGVGFNPASSSAPASVVLHEDTDNGGNSVTVIAPSSIASDKTITLPDASGILALLQTVYPVGSVYTNKTVSTNPATLFGFGTWTAIAGRVVVGLDGTQTEFDTAGETGGAKTHTLADSEIPAKSGTVTIHDDANGTNMYQANGVFSSSEVVSSKYKAGGTTTGTGANSLRNITFNNGGGGGAHNNLQPYVVCYVWERTA